MIKNPLQTNPSRRRQVVMDLMRECINKYEQGLLDIDSDLQGTLMDMFILLNWEFDLENHQDNELLETRLMWFTGNYN